MIERVENLDALAELAAAIMDPARAEPIVCLTSRPGTREPAFDVETIRGVVGDETRLVFVPDGPLTRELQRLLPVKLHVFGGAARIWWSGVGSESHPHDHPLVQDRYGVYGTQAEGAFTARWTAGAPAVARTTTRAADELLLAERDAVRRDLKKCADRVLELEAALATVTDRALSAEKRARELGRHPVPAPTSPTERHDTERDLRRAILEAWLDAIGAPERNQAPLDRYRFGGEFIESVSGLPPQAAARVPFVCAMVLCGRAKSMDGLELHALRTGASGSLSQRARASDGARAWRVSLKRHAPGAHRLHFWHLSDGTVEFATAGHHYAEDMPE